MQLDVAWFGHDVAWFGLKADAWEVARCSNCSPFSTVSFAMFNQSCFCDDHGDTSVKSCCGTPDVPNDT
jgi:hypothetical protein